MFWFNPCSESHLVWSGGTERDVRQLRAEEQLRRGESQEASSHQRRSDYLSGREPGTRQDRLLPATTPGGGGGGGGAVACAAQIRIATIDNFFHGRKNCIKRGECCRLRAQGEALLILALL